MSTSKFIVYGLAAPDGEIRYIGKSSSGLSRPKRHGHANELARDRGHKANWIRSLRARGEDFLIRILEEVTHGEDLSAAEIRWIAHGRASGWRLVNVTAGGDGLLGVKRGPLSKEWRQRLSDAHKGHRASVETRAKMSAAHRGRKKSAESIRRFVESRRKNGWLSRAAIERSANARRGKPAWNKGKKATICLECGSAPVWKGAKCRACYLTYYHKYREENRVKNREYQREWVRAAREKNPERMRNRQRIAQQKYRQQKRLSCP